MIKFVKDKSVYPIFIFLITGVSASTTFGIYSFFYKPGVKYRKEDRKREYPLNNI